MNLKFKVTNCDLKFIIIIQSSDDTSQATYLLDIGASLKDLGKKCFAISKIEDMEYIEKMSNFAWNKNKSMLIYIYKIL